MGPEAGVEAVLNILLCAVPAERDRGREGVDQLLEIADQLDAGAVGQADVADDEVEPLAVGGGQGSLAGRFQAGRRLHLQAQPPLEEACHEFARVTVVFHQQHAADPRRAGPGTRRWRLFPGRFLAEG